MKPIFQYSFVVTTLWLGFVTAISFVETPTRFSLDSVPRENILAIGNRVFHALNTSEILFASITLLGLVFGGWASKTRTIGYTTLAVLAVQSWLLFGVLDARTLAQIQGETLPPSHWHSVYIGLEVFKLLLLATLLVLQIHQFQMRTRASELR